MSISIRTIYTFLIFFTENLIKYLIIFFDCEGIRRESCDRLVVW